MSSSLCLHLYVFISMSFSLCLNLYVLLSMSTSLCLHLYVYLSLSSSLSLPLYVFLHMSSFTYFALLYPTLSYSALLNFPSLYFILFYFTFLYPTHFHTIILNSTQHYSEFHTQWLSYSYDLFHSILHRIKILSLSHFFIFIYFIVSMLFQTSKICR